MLVVGGCGNPTARACRRRQAQRTVGPTLGLPPTLLPPKVSLPPRPREIRLDGRDPCALLTADQRHQLGFDRPPVPFTAEVLNHAAACSIGDSLTNMGTGRLLDVSTGGIELYTRTDLLNVTIAPTAVVGFPALEVRGPGDEGACDIVVDVAVGQTLDVGIDSPITKRVPVTQLCVRAHTVAEAAMNSLGA